MAVSHTVRAGPSGRANSPAEDAWSDVSAFRLRRRMRRVSLDAMTGPGDVSRRLPRTVVRFATVGIANTAIDIVLFWVLNPPLGILAANFVSTSAGMTFSFLANGRHTFGATRVTTRHAVLFLATNGFTMWLLQPLLIGTALHMFAAPLIIAKVFALGASVVSNFLLYRYVVWPQEATAPSPHPAGRTAVSAAAQH
jgi:putative flippase GtrA